jgi:uncharacterized protein YecT (DUF1311 family)
MTRTAVLAVLIGTSGIVGGLAAETTPTKADPCANANLRTQLEINQCRAQEYQKADAKLNEAYKPLLAALDDEHQVLLKAAQRAWLAFRDAECQLQASQAMHGSLESFLQSTCLQALTEARIKDLKDLRETLHDFVR